MNILQINKYNHIRGGADRHFVELTECLRARRHTVVKFTLRTDHDSCLNYPDLMPTGLTSEKVADSPFAPRLHGAMASIYSFDNARRLARLIDITKPQVAHLHNIYYQLSGSLILALKRAAIPLVQTIHDFMWFCPIGSFYRKERICIQCTTSGIHNVLIHRCYRGQFLPSVMAYAAHLLHRMMSLRDYIDRFVVPSEFARGMLVSCGISPAKTVLIPHFSISEQEHTKREPGSGILFIGRLVAEKGIELLTEVAEAMADVTFSFVGDGPLRAWLDHKASNRNNIRVLGHVEGTDLKQEIRSARAVIVPSQCFEVFGLVVMEAYSQKKPVIASDRGALVEIVNDGETGYVIRDNSVTSYCKAIRKLLDNAQIAQEMGVAGHSRLLREHNPKDYARKIEEVYRIVIK